jgi:alpha-N-arabinofuranosidase
VATIDAVKVAGKHTKQVDISFDEWNVWYAEGLDSEDQPHQVKKEWREHPRLIEDEYSVTDAVVVGTLLNSLLRHGDRVRIANQAQLVNVIAPIRSEEGGPAWRQTIFWPFARMASLARGQILRLAVSADQIATEKFGDVDVIDAAATWSEADGRVALFVANRGFDSASDVTVDLRGLGVTRVASAEVLTIPEGGDRHTSNIESAPDAVGLVPLTGVGVQDGTVHLTLPPLSWSVVELEVAVS